MCYNKLEVIYMRTVNDLQNDEQVMRIIKKIKWGYFHERLKTLNDLYIANTSDTDMDFLDMVISLEPKLKQEICVGHISEREMDYFLEFYGSATSDEDN